MVWQAHRDSSVGDAQRRDAAEVVRGAIRRWLILTALLAATLGAGAQSASAYTLGGGLIASYSGTWTVHRQEGHITNHLTLTWSESYPVPGGPTGEEPYWTLTSAHGEVKQEGEAAGYSYNCEATLTINPAAATTPAGNGGWGAGIVQDNVVDPAYSNGDYWTVWDLQPPVSYYYATDPLVSSDTEAPTEQNGVCVDNEYYSIFGEGHYDTELAGVECHFDTNPEVEFDWISFPIGTSNDINDNCEAKDHQGETSWEATLKSKISFYSPGGPSPSSFGSGPSPPPPPPLPSQKKQAAQKAFEDLRNTALPNAARYCLPYAGAIGLFGAGVLTGGYLSGGTLVVAGSLTALATEPFCVAAIKRVGNDLKIYHDPPLTSVGVIARPAAASTVKLPSCKPYHGKAARFCKRLRSAYTKLVTAAQKVASITTAIEETVSRERAAYEEGNEAAMDAQNSNLVTLMGEEPTAEAAEAAAGKDVAKALKSAHIRFKLSKKASAETIARAESDLGKQGISAAELSSVDAAALKPAAGDLLTDLERL